MKKQIIIGALLLMLISFSVGQLQSLDYGTVTLETTKESTLTLSPIFPTIQNDSNTNEVIIRLDYTVNGTTKVIQLSISKDPAVAKGQLQESLDAMEKPRPIKKPVPEPEIVDITIDIEMIDK